MRCIFCKKISIDSTSVEHVLPESFGNEDHILPPGWVCDGCNNYFATKVEKPFLESEFGRSVRHFMRVPSKKGRIPSTFGLFPRARGRIKLSFDREGTLCVAPAERESEQDFVNAVKSAATGRFYIPDPGLPASDYVTSRFVTKLGLEILALHCANMPDWNEEIVEKTELDEIRNYARFGKPTLIWPVGIRQLYARDFLFPSNSVNGPHEVLHEWTILTIPKEEAFEFYVAAAIFGVELVVNLGGPELDSWDKWKLENGGGSPLYPNGVPQIGGIEID